MRSAAILLLCCPAFAAEPLVCVNLDPASAPELLAGVRLEDLPVILASLDIGVSEVDR